MELHFLFFSVPFVVFVNLACAVIDFRAQRFTARTLTGYSRVATHMLTQHPYVIAMKQLHGQNLSPRQPEVLQTSSGNVYRADVACR